MNRIRKLALLVSFASTLLLPGAGQAMEVEGVRFEPTVQIGERTLVLNGAGLRTRFGFRVYAAGLYVPARSTEAEALLAQTGPRSMAITMMRDVEAETFARALADGLEANLSAERWAAVRDRAAALDAILRGIGKAHKGDRIRFELHADESTRVLVNEQPRGEPIPGADFYGAVLRVWLGERPADSGLRKALLGG